MNEKKLRGLMGLCVRAGQGIFGEDSCLKALRNGQAALLMMDGDISGNSRDRYEEAGQKAGIPVSILPAGFLEETTGKPGMAMAVRPGGFAEQMIRCLGEKPGPEETHTI